MSQAQRHRRDVDVEEEEQSSTTASTSSWLKYTSLLAGALGAAAGAYTAYEIVKYENHRQTYQAHCENKYVTVEELLEDPCLEIGDLIEFLRVKYQHWAVYIGDGKVIHLTNNGRVRICSLKSVSENCKCRINNHIASAQKRGLNPRGSRREIVNYAESRIGKPYEYHVQNYNCEHFATECFYGTPFSDQQAMLNGAVIHRLAANASAASVNFE